MQFSILQVFTILALSTSVLGVPTSQHGSSIVHAGSSNIQSATTAGAPASASQDSGEACFPVKEGEEVGDKAGSSTKKLKEWTKLGYNCRYYLLDRIFFMKYDTNKAKDRDYWDWRTPKAKGKTAEKLTVSDGPIHRTQGMTLICCGKGLSVAFRDEKQPQSQ
ncbi:hypothetical protein MCOR25_001790 [Pyricularia grisea]|uniref:Uncharacterized protein n=1 Tax=Pyricularia grisea TaxID=148305 RepID=A0A6P8B5P7_PYRGI|nr:hypothetical protein PgNI_05254 [Pyricularia grisea]KAI6380139.1 hypothetical protein MCOR25_001790 [Pyricularia grisea]TLD10575.1 hypothetical protein PgNI_05254 [Pyricularia grisea]